MAAKRAKNNKRRIIRRDSRGRFVAKPAPPAKRAPSTSTRKIVARAPATTIPPQAPAAKRPSPKPSRKPPKRPTTPSPARRGRAPAPPTRGARPAAAKAKAHGISPDLQRLKEIQKEEKRLREEKAALTVKVAAMAPPTFPIPEGGITKLRGATYETWFKAMGAFDRKDFGKSPDVLDEEFIGDLPTLWYSQSISGKVKWFGIVSQEYVIEDLNDKAPWAGMDFRDIYPNWEYTYRINELIGGIPVRFYVHKAKRPLTMRDKRKGWEAD